MCSDVRHAFHASDEYLQGRDRNAAVGTAGHRLMGEYARERSVDSQWPRCLALGMTCATAVYGGTPADDDDNADDVDDDADDVDDDNDADDVGGAVREDGVAATRTWKRALGGLLFRFKRRPDH